MLDFSKLTSSNLAPEQKLYLKHKGVSFTWGTLAGNGHVCCVSFCPGLWYYAEAPSQPSLLGVFGWSIHEYSYSVSASSKDRETLLTFIEFVEGFSCEETTKPTTTHAGNYTLCKDCNRRNVWLLHSTCSIPPNNAEIIYCWHYYRSNSKE